MREYDIYLPAAQSDGKDVDPEKLREIKQRLAEAFGGYTYFKTRNEGVWRMGGVTFRDEITVIRVLDEGASVFDMGRFKQELERELVQESVLIVAREVTVIE
jgi:hypothetical protein